MVPSIHSTFELSQTHQLFFDPHSAPDWRPHYSPTASAEFWCYPRYCFLCTWCRTSTTGKLPESWFTFGIQFKSPAIKCLEVSHRISETLWLLAQNAGPFVDWIDFVGVFNISDCLPTWSSLQKRIFKGPSPGEVAFAEYHMGIVVHEGDGQSESSWSGFCRDCFELPQGLWVRPSVHFNRPLHESHQAVHLSWPVPWIGWKGVPWTKARWDRNWSVVSRIPRSH